MSVNWNEGVEKRVLHLEKQVENVTERLGIVEMTAESVKRDTSEILEWIKGANKIFGVARKHWKTVIIFGAGLMTSAGIGNQDTWKFISAFLGG